LTKVGLLWDSVSPNMGDRAIGLVLGRALTTRGFEPHVIDPFSPGDMSSLATVIVGGGELIRSPGDPYYDVFRAEGPCILNTVGVLDGAETGYLKDYALVSVRSQADRELLGFGEVVPCLTMLMGDHLEPPLDPIQLPADAIGIQVNFAFADGCFDLVGWLRRQDMGPVVFLPLTHYNADHLLMQSLHRNLPGSTLLPRLSPDDAFRIIGGLRGLVTCSLHGALFAYAQHVPFMALDRIPKIRAFLDDRNLSHVGFDQAMALVSGFPDVVASGTVVSVQVDRDKQECTDFLDRICAVCDDAVRTGSRSATFRLSPASRLSHEREMEMYRRQGQVAALVVQATLPKLLHTEERVTSGGSSTPEQAARRDPGSHLPGMTPLELRSELAALRRERTALFKEIGLLRSELWESRDQLARHLRSWPGRMLLVYWKAVNYLVPYGSRRRSIAKKLKRQVRELFRLPRLNLHSRAGRRAGAASAGKVRDIPLSGHPPMHRIRLSVADAGYAVLVDRVEPSDDELIWQCQEAASWPSPEEVELLTEVGDCSLEDLLRTYRSIREQTDPHWAWQPVLTPSTSSEIRSLLRSEARADKRLRIRYGPSDFSTAANIRAALESSEAPLIAILQAGDLLAPHALFRFHEELRRAPESEIAYSDFDYVSPSWLRADPVFKPDWSPETMLSINLLDNISVFRRSLLDRAGLPDAHMGQAFTWDFTNRLSGAANGIRHVPEVLTHVADTHRRFPASEIASAVSISRDQSEALREHLRRKGLRLPEVEVTLDGRTNVRWGLSREWRVSVIIPTKERKEILQRCIESLTKRTDYDPLEVILVDTGSESPEIAEYYRTLEDEAGVIVEHVDGEFNFGRSCNRGAARASGSLLLFLNNDTEALNRDWMSRMVQWFELDDIGAVGAKLLYPDGRIQHAGVIVGMGGLASHVFMQAEEGTGSIYGSTEWYRNYSAVTAACLMVRRQVFQAVGGFDEGFAVNYSDVDLCLRIRELGKRIVYTPDARLLHHESLSHRRQIPRSDFERASARWVESGHLLGDPYFSPNLSYMNPMPDYRRLDSDRPEELNRRLMKRLPRKPILSLPEDVS
jgi:GT2 family glycosyltransferase